MNALRKLIAAIEPWYNWGIINVDRMEGTTIGADGYGVPVGEGDVRYFELQWFGLHLGFQIGRTPKRDVRAKVEPISQPKLPADSDPAHVFEDHARWAATMEHAA